MRDYIHVATPTIKGTPISDVVKLVAAEFGIQPKDIIGHRRHHTVSVPRHIVNWLAYKHSRMSLPAIGRHLDRDHTTILYGFEKTEARASNDPAFFDRLKVLEARL